MRAKVLTRSRPASSGCSVVPSTGAGSCAKRRRLEKGSAQNARPTNQDTLDLYEYKGFELPQLDALVHGIDPDQQFDWEESADTRQGMQAFNTQRVMTP